MVDDTRPGPSKVTRETEDSDIRRGIYRRIFSGIHKHKGLTKVSLEAEAWFFRIHAAADDFGNVEADANLLLHATAGRRCVSADQVSNWAKELESVDLIRSFEADGEPYFHITGFLANQPSPRNGKRVRRFPASPWEESELDGRDSARVKPSPGSSECVEMKPTASSMTPELSGCIQVHPSAYQNQNQNQNQNTPSAAVDSVPQGFASFWESWPRHRRKSDLKGCLKIWQRAGLETKAAEILASLEKWKKCHDWQKEAGNYIPGPAVWLNKKRWEAPLDVTSESRADLLPSRPNAQEQRLRDRSEMINNLVLTNHGGETND